MATGACGIDCNTCRLKLRGLCMGCGAGCGSLAGKKLQAQLHHYGQCCPVLECARNRQVAFCLRDCRRFPCRIFEQGPAPYSPAFLKVQKSTRRTPRRPTLDLKQMSGWLADELDPDYWDRLIRNDPGDVCRRALVSFDRNGENYRVDFLGCTYRVHPYSRFLEGPAIHSGLSTGKSEVSMAEGLILLNYLLGAKDVPAHDQWITEKEIPGGEPYFQGPHSLSRQPVLNRYGRNPAGFLEAGRSLGGRSLAVGDAAVELRVLPRIPLRYILWLEAEGFSAHLTIAFDSTVKQHLPLDVIWVLINHVSERLAGTKRIGRVACPASLAVPAASKIPSTRGTDGPPTR